MTQLEFYQVLMQQCRSLENRGREMVREAHTMEASIQNRFGVYCVQRDPGFPGWTHKSLTGHYYTPEEVLVMLDTKGGEEQ